MNEKKTNQDNKITVAGLSFSAAEVVSAVLKIDGREICIKEKEEEPKTIGFHHEKTR